MNTQIDVINNYIKEQSDSLKKNINHAIFLDFVKSDQYSYWQSLQKILKNNIDNSYLLDMLYEIYLSSFVTPKYKYRIMFILFRFPFIDIILEKSIADEINHGNCYLSLSDQNAFLHLLEQILISNKVSDIISNLNHIIYLKTNT